MKQRHNLMRYIKDDIIYQEYKKGKLVNPNDFEMYCIKHCEDIEKILEINEILRKKLGYPDEEEIEEFGKE